MLRIDVMLDGKHESISHAQRIRNIVEEIELADQLGLDIYGLGEHHRKTMQFLIP